MTRVIAGSHGERLDLRIKQGTSFAIAIFINNPDGSPVDLFGCSARAAIRADFSDQTPAASFSITVLRNGEIRLSLDPLQTSSLLVKGQSRTYWWDIEIEWPDGRVDSPLFGQAIILAEVTK